MPRRTPASRLVQDATGREVHRNSPLTKAAMSHTMKLQLRALVALALCVALAVADEPHKMHKLVAKAVRRYDGSNKYGKAFYVDSDTGNARADDELGMIHLHANNKHYYFNVQERTCQYLEYDQRHHDPADDFFFGTLTHMLGMVLDGHALTLKRGRSNCAASHAQAGWKHGL